MNSYRRNFMGTVLALTTFALALQMSAASAAEGYELVDPAQNTSNSETVEIVEFFWLGCPHCYDFEPSIEKWKRTKSANVTLVREAPPLNPSWEEHSRGFYAASFMGKEQAFVDAMFKAIHEDGKRMRKPDDMADLAQDIGLDREKFLRNMNSFSVQTRINRAIQLSKSTGISAVPSIVINGKYRTSARLAGGNEGMIDVINKTVAIEKTSMGLD